MNLLPAAILPIAGFALYRVLARGRVPESRADVCLKVLIGLFAFVLLSTEAISFAHQLSGASVALAWLVFCAALWLIGSRRTRSHVDVPGMSCVSPIGGRELVAYSMVGFLLLATLVTAIVYPPNNYDSLTYHLPRVMHWAENHSVDYYFTHIPRQNYQPPLAEYAILHLYLLTGGEYLFNLVQWVAYCGMVLVSVLLVRELGGARHSQIIAALLTATLPMAVLQASTTQNDLVVSVFIGSFALYMLRIGKDLCFRNLFYCAMSLGLAMMVKGSAYIYCAPVGVILAVYILFSNGSLRERAMRLGGLFGVVVVALMLNAPFYLRNYHFYGKLIGATDDSIYYNDVFSIHYTLSNIVRNAALHLTTFSDSVNANLTEMFRGLLDGAADNPHSTWMREKFQLRNSTPDEDSSGNFVHLFIIVLLVISLVRAVRQSWRADHVRLAAAAFSGALLYCVILKWQPWATRLHTPVFLMLLPVFAYMIPYDRGALRRFFVYLLVAGCFIWSLPFVFACRLRSWDAACLSQSRAEARLNAKPALVSDYTQVLDFLLRAKARCVGIVSHGDAVEYPLWALRDESRAVSSLRFVHFSPRNIGSFMDPEFVLVLSPMSGATLSIGYDLVCEFGSIGVYRSTFRVRPHDDSSFKSGWAGNEGTHRWSNASVSELQFSHVAASDARAQLILDGFTHGAQSVVISLNGVRIFEGEVPGRGSLPINVSSRLFSPESNRLTFKWSNAHSPNSSDSRLLAYALVSLRVVAVK